MNDGGPSSEEIIEAIKVSGYLMEQEVATLIESLGFHVQTNRAFQDPDEKKSREIDVWAIKQVYKNEDSKIAVYAELLCETKNNINPFVFIGRNKTSADKIRTPMEYLFPVPKYEVTLSSNGDSRSFREIPAFSYLNLAESHYYYQLELKAVQFCKIVRDRKSWKANHEGIYDAIFYPLVKCLFSRQQEIKQIRGDWKYAWLFFPIVVLNSDIFYLDSGANPPALEGKGNVTFVRELMTDNINGYFFIDFVTKNALCDFISSSVMQFTEHVAKMARDSPSVLLNKDNPLNTSL